MESKSRVALRNRPARPGHGAFRLISELQLCRFRPNRRLLPTRPPARLTQVPLDRQRGPARGRPGHRRERPLLLPTLPLARAFGQNGESSDASNASQLAACSNCRPETDWGRCRCRRQGSVSTGRFWTMRGGAGSGWSAPSTGPMSSWRMWQCSGDSSSTAIGFGKTALHAGAVLLYRSQVASWVASGRA